ncbi:MAG TPA: cytochrome c biogenesis protein CcdA [Candidatus Polarisedimenticolia bacterium]|nr:cytochrome c biogenesis protein CcdA [Candidatus Polarisedimenticolia bacterium]
MPEKMIPPRSIRRALCALALLAWAAAPVSAQSFTSARVVKARTVVSFDKVHPGSAFRAAVEAQVEPGWHINADRPTLDYLIATQVELSDPAEAPRLTLGAPVYPPFAEQAFSFTDGKTLRVFEGRVLIGLEGTAPKDIPPGGRTLAGTLTVQACNDTSCLAPARIPLETAVVIAAPGEPINAIHGELFEAIRFSGGAYVSQEVARAEDRIGRLVDESGWGMALAWIFLGGLALNLTPCVYPLIPITLAYFGGQASGRSGHAFSLASLYVLGMCVTYSALGVAAATTGSVLGSALQSPAALLLVAAVMVALGLSMLGLYDIRLPTALTRRITSRPGYGGALFMGLTVGLVAAPCVGPFVVSLLAYVGQSGSPLLGFWLFFVLALGLGVPYLLLGGFAGRATGLPRAGAWMEWVKKVFACVLFAMAAYFLNPLLPGAVAAYTIPAVLLVSALYLGFMEGSPIRGAGFRAARLGVAAGCAVLAALLLIPSTAASAEIAWTPYSDEALAEAAGRPAIIDFTADWCLPCKELDHFTFGDPRVAEASRSFVMLRADITRQLSEPVARLQKEYAILGAPTIVFLDAEGRERRDLRLTGFEGADRFLERMSKAR